MPNVSTSHIKTLNPRAPNNYWFSKTLFTAEQVGTYGNVKRNFFHGPGFNYTNMQLSKNFHLTEQRYLQLRVEAFNAFNHANFAGPNGNYSSSSFGQITSTISSAEPNGDPQPGRAIQLSGKLFF